MNKKKKKTVIIIINVITQMCLNQYKYNIFLKAILR